MSDFTPTTEQVRNEYAHLGAWASENEETRAGQFDRWLEQTLREERERTKAGITEHFDLMHAGDEPDPWYWSDAADIASEWEPFKPPQDQS